MSFFSNFITNTDDVKINFYTYFVLSFNYASHIQPYNLLNTGWRKKNACSSNNCNFVYFQYKEIMSTPKQPVINAVLITYIDYSITENYIGKMA